MFYSYKKEKGRCGLPLLSGSAGVLLSGGFDSPVATYMLMKRGVSVFAIHFYSFPYTSEKSKSKVIDICAKLSEYSDAIKLFVVNFTEIMILISKNSKEEYLTVLMRRQMMKIAERITLNNGGSALVTGENLGQVASQTIENLSVTNNATKLLVMRPLIGMEKDEIINYSKMIGTYDISKEPYQDCCTVFVPKHPKTNSKIEKVLKLEQDLYDNTNMLEKIEESIKNVEIIGDFEN